MLPFLTLPIGIVNSEQNEKVVDARIAPSEIEYYYPGFYKGTVVVMKSGNSYLTPMATTDLDEVLAKYKKFLKANPGQFGVMEIK